MKKILIINPYYYPGYRSGGPQQTIMNIVDMFGDEYEFYVLTANHDMGCTEIYTGIEDSWNKVGKAKVKYLPDKELNVNTIAALSKKMDLLYTGGLFEKTTIAAMIANKRKKLHCSLAVAPMGVFSEGAIKQKALKKKIFLKVGRYAGIFRNIFWSFTSEMEVEDFKRYLGTPKRYEIARDIPRKYINCIERREVNKEVGKLKVIFLSRICPKKNPVQAINIVSKLKGEIQFDIYGTKEDITYWNQCEEKLNTLPPNVHWNFKGEVESSRVIDIFMQYDVFLFPTLGENFGHVIYESLMAGCVPVLSDTTPWQNFDKKNCGNVIYLQDEERFIEVMEKYVEMSKKEYCVISENAMRNAMECYAESARMENGYRKIFAISKFDS